MSSINSANPLPPSTANTTISSEPGESEKCAFIFDPHISEWKDWPSRAVAWLAMIRETISDLEYVTTEKQKYEIYKTGLGFGPSARLVWAQKSGEVRNLSTFIEWFEKHYIDFVKRNRLETRYENVRQTSTVRQYILDFDSVHRFNFRLLPLERVVRIFIQNLRSRDLALWVDLHKDPGMDLQDVMIMVSSSIDERLFDEHGFELAASSSCPTCACMQVSKAGNAANAGDAKDVRSNTELAEGRSRERKDQLCYWLYFSRKEK